MSTSYTKTGYAFNSQLAFSFIQPKLTDCQKEVYDAMRAMNRQFTDKDLAHFMGFEINRITPRRGELVKKGLIRKAGDVIRDGRKASLWEVGGII